MNGIDPWKGKAVPWPGNNGFEGEPQDHTLKPGDKIDRYGDEKGSYVAPEGKKFSERSLPLDAAKKPMTRYIVLEEIRVKAGPTAPAFGQRGGGAQYYFGDRPIRYHLSNGKLVQY
jgi:hypothetical protein